MAFQSTAPLLPRAPPAVWPRPTYTVEKSSPASPSASSFQRSQPSSSIMHEHICQRWNTEKRAHANIDDSLTTFPLVRQGASRSERAWKGDSRAMRRKQRRNYDVEIESGHNFVQSPMLNARKSQAMAEPQPRGWMERSKDLFSAKTWSEGYGGIFFYTEKRPLEKFEHDPEYFTADFTNESNDREHEGPQTYTNDLSLPMTIHDTSVIRPNNARAKPSEKNSTMYLSVWNTFKGWGADAEENGPLEWDGGF